MRAGWAPIFASARVALSAFMQVRCPVLWQLHDVGTEQWLWTLALAPERSRSNTWLCHFLSIFTWRNDLITPSFLSSPRIGVRLIWDSAYYIQPIRYSLKWFCSSERGWSHTWHCFLVVGCNCSELCSMVCGKPSATSYGLCLFQAAPCMYSLSLSVYIDRYFLKKIYIYIYIYLFIWL